MNKKVITNFSLALAGVFSLFIANNTYADTYTKTALIRVSDACTMTANSQAAPHTKTIPLNTYEAGIGTTIVSTACNDNGGFAVYAIGFTDDTDGNNYLEHGTDSTIKIATGTAESGNTSNWAMKLEAVNNNSPLVIDNGYDDYSVVPDDYVKVAHRTSATNTDTSIFKTTYAAFINATQPAGTYTGQVKYVLVHPSTAAAPQKEGNVPPYIDPDPDITKPTTHSDGTVFQANSLLRAYEIAYTKAGKPMYIEDASATTTHGWRPMTEADEATVGGKEVRFAMQDIDMTLDGTVSGTKVCNAAASSSLDSSYLDEAQVLDLRDGKTYWISKLADGKCWMTQNLDLDLSTSITLTPADTDITANWTPVASTLPQGSTSGWDYDSSLEGIPHSADVGTIQMGPNVHYRLGNYYNLAAAVASNDIGHNIQHDASYNTSICAKGWRLPTITYPLSSTATDDFSNLVYTYGWSNSFSFVTAPFYMPASGRYNSNQMQGTGSEAWVISNSEKYDSGSSNTQALYLMSNAAYASGSAKVGGFSIRCIAR